MSVLKFVVHPGRILKEEFLDPADVSPIALAHHLGVPRTRIERLVRGETGITSDTAKRLAAAFETSAEFWMNLQTAHDLATAPAPKGIRPIAEMA